MPGLGCFSNAELQAFLLGDLPQRVSEAVAAHLEVCAKCQARADLFDGLTDPVVCSLRQAHRSASGGEATTDGTAAEVHNGTVAAPAADSERPSLRVAGYTILEELGRGGMSVVYKARQSQPDRLVALKMILAGGHAGPERRTRFLAEADAIARLQHPGIVQVHEVGENDGLPFLILEYLAGGSLAERTHGQPQPPRQAAELVETLARAIHHAHQQGIVHRDLKPSNILLTAQGQPKVSDFGLAKQERPELTATGAVLGTPSYMAPEQASGDNRAVGPAADVYALGAILYELLTSRPPFRGATTLDTLEQVRSQEVVPPSQLQLRTPHDLNTLCLKCLHKEQGRRYVTALELADDLRRFLDGKLVLARPVGVAERLWRWSRRKPAWAAMLLTVAGLLLVILIGGSVGLVRLNAALQQSENNRRESENNLVQTRKAERATEEQLFDALLAQARGNCLSRQPGQRFESLAILRRATRLARELELPAERFLQLRNAAILALALPDLHVTQTWNGVPDGHAQVDFDEELAVYAWMDTQGNCEVRRVAGDQLLHRFPAPPDSVSLGGSAVLSRDGRFLSLTWCYDAQRFASKQHLFRLTGDKDSEWLFEEQDVSFAAFDKDGRRLVAGHGDGSVSVRELDPKQPATLLRRFPSGTFKRNVAAALHPTEPWVAVTSYFGPNVVEIRDYRSGTVLHTLELPQNGGDVAWHPHGHTLAVSSGDGTDIWLYESATWKRTRTLHSVGAGNVLTFNSPGDRLASVAWGGQVSLFDVGTGKLLFQTPPIAVPMARLRFSRDGCRLARTSNGKQIGIWEVGDGREYRTLLYEGGGAGKFGDRVAVWSDNRLLMCSVATRFCFWDLETGAEVGTLPVDQLGWHHLVPAGSGRPGALMIETASGLHRWPIEQALQIPGTIRIGPPQLLSPIHAYWTDHSRDGRLLAGASRTIAQYQPHAGGWVLRADRSGHPIRRLAEGRDILHVALSPRGDLAVTSPQLTGVNRVWDVASGRLLRELNTASGTFPCFSPDGKWLAVSGDTGALYAVDTWKEGLGFSGIAQFSPDSQQLVVRTKSGDLRLIDIRKSRDLAWFADPNQEVGGFHLFTPDGTRLITVSNGKEGGIHVWDLRAIRRQLKALDLDWEAPDYPPEPPPSQTPLRLEIVADATPP